jgi:hypothetical protein
MSGSAAAGEGESVALQGDGAGRLAGIDKK